MTTALAVAMAAAVAAIPGGAASAEPQEFTVEVVRRHTKDGLIYGTLGIDGAAVGGTFEHADLKIPAGTYKGVLRYWSKKGFVQGPLGQLGNTGDFLLEVANVKDAKGPRTDILFHAGNKPHHTLGCILLGPVSSKIDGAATVDAKHPLRILRRKFYGTDEPNATPNKKITIVITDK